MSGLIAATEPARTIVIERGGTPWWIPFATALFVALAAAAASYYAAWRFKKSDVNRENAFRAAELVDQAEQIASRQDRYEAEGGPATTMRLLHEARVRAEPVADSDLDDRFKAALLFNFDLQVWHDPEPPGGRHWLYEAIANIRGGLVPHLSAPQLTGRPRPPKRSFPGLAELNAMANDAYDGNVRINALTDWRINRDQDG